MSCQTRAKKYDQPGSPNEGACFRYVMNRDRLRRGEFKICDQPGSPNEGAGSRNAIKQDRLMRGGRVSDM